MLKVRTSLAVLIITTLFSFSSMAKNQKFDEELASLTHAISVSEKALVRKLEKFAALETSLPAEFIEAKKADEENALNEVKTKMSPQIDNLRSNLLEMTAIAEKLSGVVNELDPSFKLYEQRVWLAGGIHFNELPFEHFSGIFNEKKQGAQVIKGCEVSRMSSRAIQANTSNSHEIIVTLVDEPTYSPKVQGCDVLLLPLGAEALFNEHKLTKADVLKMIQAFYHANEFTIGRRGQLEYDRKKDARTAAIAADYHLDYDLFKAELNEAKASGKITSSQINEVNTYLQESVALETLKQTIRVQKLVLEIMQEKQALVEYNRVNISNQRKVELIVSSST
ncbi:hypothetical protein [Glaciecola sp. 1036]|uniref:hypothetical protein n=1 Tax=Alteromonadaceae TaxID=72275 RepID=UPI003D02FFEB